MPRRQTIPYNEGVFFITFSCFNHLNLIEKVSGYDIVYKWFDNLKQEGHHIHAYVIMPNHVHAIISFANTNKLINTIIGNGKRFMAYEIIKRLEQANDLNLLQYLSKNVRSSSKAKSKFHEVWDLSFFWIECNSKRLQNQKLEYIHNNPCAGKWMLSSSPINFLHSSAAFYETGEQGIYEVKHILEIDDINYLGLIDATSPSGDVAEKESN